MFCNQSHLGFDVYMVFLKIRGNNLKIRKLHTQTHFSMFPPVVQMVRCHWVVSPMDDGGQGLEKGQVG